MLICLADIDIYYENQFILLTNIVQTEAQVLASFYVHAQKEPGIIS